MWESWFPSPDAARVAAVACWWLGLLAVAALAGSILLALAESGMVKAGRAGDWWVWWVWCWLEPMLMLLAGLLVTAACVVSLAAFSWWG